MAALGAAPGDLSPLNWFLGIRIVRDRVTRILCANQTSYIKEITYVFGVERTGGIKDRSLTPTGMLQPCPPGSRKGITRWLDRTVPSKNRLYTLRSRNHKTRCCRSMQRPGPIPPQTFTRSSFSCRSLIFFYTDFYHFSFIFLACVSH